MASLPAPVDEYDFLVQPLVLPAAGTLSPDAGFCDGCSGCKVITRPGRVLSSSTGAAAVEDDEFLVEPLSVIAPGPETAESWCAGCKGCSASCRSSIR